MAEVLITLGIIGVVASMTISSVITTFRKQQTVAMLKKAYTEINQALHMAIAEHGAMDTWTLQYFSTSTERNVYFFESYLKPYLSLLHYKMPSSKACWPEDVYTMDNKKITYWINSNTTARGCFASVAGYTVYFWAHGTGQGAWFIVDVNGLKRPNVLGRDIFPFLASWGNEDLLKISGEAYKLGVYPLGLHLENTLSRNELLEGSSSVIGSTARYANCKYGTNKTYAGGFCAAVIMMDGWEIKDDYPWK